MGRVGFEHPSLKPSKTSVSTDDGAKSGAHRAPSHVEEANVAEVVAVWAELPGHIKAAVNALIQTHKTETK
jgi:hypothetical protein